MIRLTQPTSDLISLITGQNGAKVVVSYSDATASAYTGGNQVTSIASATTTTICSTPAASTVRDVDYINIKNTFAGSHAMTIQVSVSATLYVLLDITLLASESVCYTHGSGWCALDANGNRKETVSSVNSSAVLGTTTNDTAAVGRLGEYITSGVIAFTNVPLTTVVGDLASISLTAGDWDISAVIAAFANGATVTAWAGGIGTTTGNSFGGSTEGDNRLFGALPTAATDMGIAIPPWRVSIAATTTYYLKIYAAYTVATPQASGRISARRVR